MILIRLRQFVEIATPAPDADNKVLMILRVLLRVQQHFPIDGVQLKLMTAQIDKRLYKGGNLSNTVWISEGVVVDLQRKRSTVDDLGHIVLGEGLDAGKGAPELSRNRRRKA